MATQLGARYNKEGKLIVDRHQRTTVPALYAAGDVVDELNQIRLTAWHAALAATDIYNRSVSHPMKTVAEEGVARTILANRTRAITERLARSV